jgi:hypothetical protein
MIVFGLMGLMVTPGSWMAVGWRVMVFVAVSGVVADGGDAVGSDTDGCQRDGFAGCGIVYHAPEEDDGFVLGRGGQVGEEDEGG